MADSDCRAVVTEVSSQALKQHRTDGIEFDIGIFTNLSPDHIGEGEHKNFEEYAECKSRLFRQSRLAVLNADSKYAARMTEHSGIAEEVFFGLSEAKDIHVFREHTACV